MIDAHRDLCVPPDLLRWQADEELGDFVSTAEVEPVLGAIAQDRALDALRMGIENNAPGFNIFVSGITGTGRTSTVASILREISPTCRIAPDRAYVHNFDEEDRPRLLAFPRGRATEFANRMRELARHLLENVPKIFESPQFEARRKAILERHSSGERERLQAFEKDLKRQGLALATVTVGEMSRPQVVVRIGDEAVAIPGLQSLVEAGEMEEARAEELRAAHATAQSRLEEIIKETRAAMQTMAGELDALVKDLGAVVLDEDITSIKADFVIPEVRDHLDRVRTFVLENLELFAPEPGEGSAASRGGQREGPQRSAESTPLPLAVNVLIDNSHVDECPIIMEPRPSFRNLFGVIERVSDRYGSWYTDFTRIHAGSLLRADGGALVLTVKDVLSQPHVWSTLKNVLRFRQLEIQNPAQMISLGGGEAISPEPIPVDVKVVLIGSYGMYQLLSAEDPDFAKIFKVLAHFDHEMPASQESFGQLAGLIARIGDEESLLPVDRSGFAALLEHLMRRAGRRGRLPTRFGDVADVIREADYYARKDGKAEIDAGTIDRTIEFQRRRHSLTEEKLTESISTDTIMIATQGRVVGQINGLAVYDMRAYRFGKPSRLTVSTGVGGAGLINIEREAGLSGQTHDKGVLILTGYLRRTFAQDAPLTLSASIAFEQSYGMIDGDSASSTELYALLSDVAQLPIDQGFAVTGSVNQHGDIQPIGGVNEKIECFYDLCAERGLTGTQGILIPHQNVPDLQLKPEIVDAVAAGKFRIFAVHHIDQGVEILTGRPVAEVHKRVRERLREFNLALRGHSGDAESRDASAPAKQSEEPPGPPPPGPPTPPPPSPVDPREPH